MSAMLIDMQLRNKRITKEEKEFEQYYKGELLDKLDLLFFSDVQEIEGNFDYEIQFEQIEEEGEMFLHYYTDCADVYIKYHEFERREWKLTGRKLITIMIDEVECTSAYM